jgi:hypothetical protein
MQDKDLRRMKHDYGHPSTYIILSHVLNLSKGCRRAKGALSAIMQETFVDRVLRERGSYQEASSPRLSYLFPATLDRASEMAVLVNP